MFTRLQGSTKKIVMPLEPQSLEEANKKAKKVESIFSRKDLRFLPRQDTCIKIQRRIIDERNVTYVMKNGAQNINAKREMNK